MPPAMIGSSAVPPVPVWSLVGVVVTVVAGSVAVAPVTAVVVAT